MVLVMEKPVKIGAPLPVEGDLRALTQNAILVKKKMGHMALTIKEERIEDAVKTIHGLRGVNRITTAKKYILPSKAVSPINACLTAASEYFQTVTLPWAWAGWGLLPAVQIIPFRAKMNEFKENLDVIVQDFLLNDYQRLVEKQRQELGSLFRPEDYPSPEDLRKRWYIKLDFEPLPSPQNITKENIPEEIRQELVQNAEVRLKESIENSVRSVYDRLFEVIEHLMNAVDKYNVVNGKVTGKFRVNSIENVSSLLNIVPMLNITNDPKLTEVSEQIKERILRYGAEELRASPNARKDLKSATLDIMTTLAPLRAPKVTLSDDEETED